MHAGAEKAGRDPSAALAHVADVAESEAQQIQPTAPATSEALARLAAELRAAAELRPR